MHTCIKWDSTPQLYQITSEKYARHYSDAIMGAIASQVTSLTIVYSTVYSGADQRKHQSSASLAFVREIHRRPVNSPHKGPVARKMFPFDDVIMVFGLYITVQKHLPPKVLKPEYFRLVGQSIIVDVPQLVQIMACRLFGAKLQWTFFLSKFIHFHSRQCFWKCLLWYGSHFVSASICQGMGNHGKNNFIFQK